MALSSSTGVAGASVRTVLDAKQLCCKEKFLGFQAYLRRSGSFTNSVGIEQVDAYSIVGPLGCVSLLDSSEPLQFPIVVGAAELLIRRKNGSPCSTCTFAAAKDGCQRVGRAAGNQMRVPRVGWTIQLYDVWHPREVQATQSF